MVPKQLNLNVASAESSNEGLDPDVLVNQSVAQTFQDLYELSSLENISLVSAESLIVSYYQLTGDEINNASNVSEQQKTIILNDAQNELNQSMQMLEDNKPLLSDKQYYTGMNAMQKTKQTISNGGGGNFTCNGLRLSAGILFILSAWFDLNGYPDKADQLDDAAESLSDAADEWGCPPLLTSSSVICAAANVVDADYS
ncbi:MAG: hypothetical protein V5A68_06175 [Candidatus Thermoplasmatota archaeon]